MLNNLDIDRVAGYFTQLLNMLRGFCVGTGRATYLRDGPIF